MTDCTISTAISCLHYEWQTLPEAFSRAREFHLGGIEFSTSRLSETDYLPCAKLAADTGMTVSLHAWSNLPRMSLVEGVDEARYLLDICRQMTARHLIVHLGSHEDRAVGLERIAHVLAAVAPDYEAAQVVICLENHYPYSYKNLCELGGEPEDFAYLFQLIPSPAVGFCLDYGHSHMAGLTEEFIAELGPHLRYCHIADSLGEHDDHLAPGDGTVQWDRVLDLTLKAGFFGPYVIEFPEQGDPSRFARFLDSLHRAAARVCTGTG